MSEKTPSWGIDPVPGAAARPERARLDAALGQPLGLAARDRDRRAARARRSRCETRCSRSSSARSRGNVAPRPGRADRRGRARPGHGAAARAARPQGLVRADRAQRRPERRLVDLRADHHRRRRRRALAARLRLERQVALDDRLRRAQLGPRHARPDRLRPPLPAQVRVLGPPLRDGVPHVLGDLEVAPARVLGAAGQGRLPVVRPGRRPRDRQRRLVDAARRRLHALRPHAPRRRSRRRARLLRADDLVRRARDPHRARARRRRRAGAARRRGRRRRRRVRGAARDHDRREREGVRRHLLHRRLDPEPAAAHVPAAADHARLGRCDGARARARTSATTRTSSTCSAPSSSRSSACSPATGSRRAPTTRRASVFDAPAFRLEQLGAWLVGFCLYQWLSPVGPSWWTTVVAHTHPGNVSFTASLPSFAASFALAFGFALAARDSATPVPAEAQD